MPSRTSPRRLPWRGPPPTLLRCRQENDLMHRTSQRALPGAAPALAAAPPHRGPPRRSSVVPGTVMQGHTNGLPRIRVRIVAA